MGCINPEYITMNILIYTTEPFPSGTAATNRILSYCHGFIENKASVTVITNSSRKSKDNLNYGNWLKHVNIISFAMPDFIQSKLSRLIHRQLTWLRTLYTVKSCLKKEDFDALLFVGCAFGLEKMLWRLSEIHNILTLKEISEHPNLTLPKNIRNLDNVIQKQYLNNYYDNYGFVTSMTNPIKKFLIESGLNEQKITIIPHTIILDSFIDNYRLPSLEFDDYIAYTGSFSDSKDGVLKLVEAFNLVNKSFANIGLVIAGFGTKEQKSAIYHIINKLGLKMHVQVIENLDNAAVPSLISHAKLLVLCRPNSLQAQYGFPTKAVEYLATGKPVLTTVHGDMEHYFKHGQNSFILESTEPIHVAKSIIEVLNNYENAILIGQNGKQMAELYFDSVKNSRIILDIIDKCSRL